MENGGKLAGVYVGKQKGTGKVETGCAELIAGHGLRGDNHAGRDPRRQVSLFAQETLNQLLAEGFNITASNLSANLFTEQIKLDSLKPGTQLRIGQSLIEIVEARKPCRSITRIDSRLPKRLYDHCGQLARIIKGGSIQPGDEIEVLTSRQPTFPEFCLA
jgi:MOSC domain-containing protein YiiM